MTGLLHFFDSNNSALDLHVLLSKAEPVFWKIGLLLHVQRERSTMYSAQHAG